MDGGRGEAQLVFSPGYEIWLLDPGYRQGVLVMTCGYEVEVSSRRYGY